MTLVMRGSKHLLNISSNIAVISFGSPPISVEFEVQFVEGQVKRRDEMLEEVLDFGHIERRQLFQRLFRRKAELKVPGLQFLEALDVCRELVGGLYQRPRNAPLGRREERLVRCAHFRRKRREQLPRGHGLDPLVRGHDVRVEILDRRRHVAGEYLRRVVEKRRRRRAPRVGAQAQDVASYDGERVRDDGDYVRVFLDVFDESVPHQRPARDVPHP